MAFTINKQLVFIDSMQFINSSLDALVKNLSDIDLKYLSQELSGDLFKLVKQKQCIHLNIWTYGHFLEINYLIGINALVFLKMNVFVKKLFTCY